MLAWLEGVHIVPVHRTQLAVFAGQSPTSSGYSNNLGRLRSLGLIDYVQRRFSRREIDSQFPAREPEFLAFPLELTLSHFGARS
jgi:hypothetical protein